ncbi:hypothetical protein PT974_07530 [Cladobotryum mycophilum]|uniref:Uncharacterized protein n=1 Tax=Cladobotryum mycophilum TaxID=491253 RepID=A0ABR0SPJ0_9HYPO
MADHVKVKYSFRDVETYEKQNPRLRQIIQESTGAESWVETKSIPPIGFPRELLSVGVVEKLRTLDGVHVEEINE